jgi:MFS family permease
LLRDEYPQYSEIGKIQALEGAVASAALFGSIIGQIIAGSLADIIGRKKLFVATAILITIGAFGSALTMDTPQLTIYGQIACWRFFLGAGVGGKQSVANIRFS